MKRTIFSYDFSPYYPAGIQPCPMYVDVANRIYDSIKDMDIAIPGEDDLKKEIAINVAIYYEDKMSDIGLWNAFVARHLLTYLHSLPFFDDFDETTYPGDNDDAYRWFRRCLRSKKKAGFQGVLLLDEFDSVREYGNAKLIIDRIREIACDRATYGLTFLFSRVFPKFVNFF